MQAVASVSAHRGRVPDRDGRLTAAEKAHASRDAARGQAFYVRALRETRRQIVVLLRGRLFAEAAIRRLVQVELVKPSIVSATLR
jgi:hypothetical protein